MRRRKLLIVEDHPLMVEAIRVAVDADGDFEVVGVVTDGPAAVDAVARLEPDVVLLDLRLAAGDGIDVMRELRSSAVQTKFVVLSGSDGADAVQRALGAGASAVISKRIDPHDLPGALRQAFDQ